MRLVSKNERNRTVAPFPEQESADSSGNNLPAHASDRSSNVEGLPLSGDGYSVSGNDLAAGDKALSIRSAYVLEGEDEVPPINDSSSDVADRTRSRSAQHDDDIALHSSGEARGFTDGSEKGRHSSSHQDSAGKAPVDARSSRNGSNIQEPSFGETRRESGREDTSEQNIESVNRRRHYSGSPLHREMEESTLGMEFLRIASRPRGPEARFEEAKRIGTQTIRHHKHRHRDTIPDYSSSRRHEHGDSRFQDDHIERSRPAMMTGRYTDRIGDQPSSYQKPVTRLREPLSFDVPLDGTQGDRLTLEPWDWYNRPLKNARKYSTRLLHILKATKLVDEAGKHRINLKYHANVSESDANLPISIKWLHVEQRRPDFEEFSRIALGTPGLTSEYKTVVSALLNRIQDRGSQKANRSLFWNLRADGRFPTELLASKAPVTATSMSFPCFSTGHKHQSERYPIRALFDWDNTSGVSQEWDAKQMFRTLEQKNEMKDHIIFVPNIWVLLVHDCLITYGPKSMTEMLGDQIQLHEHVPETRGSPSLVQVKNLYGDGNIYSLKDCPSFIELFSAVFERPYDAGIADQLVFSLPDGSRVTASNWLHVLNSEKSDTLNLISARTEGSQSPRIYRQFQFHYQFSQDDPVNGIQKDHQGPSGSTGGAQLPDPTLEREGNTAKKEPEPDHAVPVSVPYRDISGDSNPRVPSVANTADHEATEGGREKTSIEIDATHLNLIAPTARRNSSSSEKDLGNVGEAMISDSSHEENDQSRRVRFLDTARQDPTLRLSIPPFLSWVMMSQSGITEEMSTASYYRLLGAMDDILTHDTEHGQAYRSSPGISREMLDSGYLRQEEGRAPSYQWFNIDKILDIIDGDHGADLVHRDLLVDCHETMNEIFRIVQALLSCYLPLSSPASDHPLIRKIWGAFYSMTNTLERVLRSNLTSYKDLASTTWAIRDWSRHPRLVRHNTQPTQSWRSCRSCTKSVEYIRRLDAGLHILENHYGQSSPLKAEVLLSFARNDRQFLVDARMDLVLGCLRTTNTVVQRLLSEAKDIQTWVARGPDAISGRYTLPNSLLRSLRYATMTLITIPRSMEEMDAWVTQLGKTAKPRHKKVKRLWYFGNRDWDDLWPYELAGMRSSDSMADAKREISSMAYLGSTRSSSTDAVGPEYMLSTVMSGLFHERFYKGLSIDKIYLSIYTKLHRDGMNHPRTKILSSIWSLKKELNLIDGIRYFQQIHLQDFCSILHPNSFLAPPPSRRFLFQVEEPFLQKQIERLERSRFHLQDLDFRLRDESNHVSTMLMVREESKGNAIIVFTIVTIIFLPLSWATSYLGMNTSDIRDLRQGQWLYWSIAAPVTCLVIGIAALVAMKGDEIREFFIRREGFRYQKKEEKAKRLVRQGTALSMVPQPRWKEMWSSFRERRRERREHDRV